MKPRITMITIGVDDLERSLTFYRDGLGLPMRGIVGTEFEHGAVAFFDLMNGLKLAIWARKDMAHEAKVPLGPRSSTEFSLGHNVASKAEVDTIIEQAGRAGRSLPILRMMRFGVDTPARFRIPMDISGKSHGIQRWSLSSRLSLVVSTFVMQITRGCCDDNTDPLHSFSYSNRVQHSIL